MSLVLDGSNGVTFPNSTTQAVAGLTGSTSQLCKAWVNYNGSSQTINGSYNVSSVTYSSTGQYVVNFTTTMGSTNFAVAVSTNKDNDINDANIRITTGTNTTLVTTSTSVPITIFRGDGTAVNPTRVGVVIFA
jgi:hypothetical protein